MAKLEAQVDKYLTNASRGLFPSKFNFIADKVLPKIMVKQTSGLIGSYDKEHLRIVNSVMGGRGEAPRVDVGTKSTNTYLIEKHGLSDIVSEEDYDNVEAPFDAELDSVNFLLSRLWLGKEKALADSLTSSSVMTNYTTLSGSQQWSDWTNSDPLSDLKTARVAVRDACGIAPNSAILEWEVADTLRYHPAILESLGFSRARAGQLTDDDLKKALDVQNLYVGSAMYNSSNQGQTDSLGKIWGTNAVMYYSPPAPTKRDQALGFYVARGSERQVYKNNVNNPPKAKEIIVIDSYDFIITDVNCGYLIAGAIG